MHTIKAGWVGQTYALAKCNESEGRKSRIRRSKEERKAMVESFIKKYQSSNNGDFPSLSLTTKEVGGSFYTVREIVREIIQENRVLGPAKLTPEEQQMQNADQFLEQYPLGSISYEPHIPLTSSPNGTDLVYDNQKTSGEVVASTNEFSEEPEHQGLNNGRIINGSQIDIKMEDASDVRCIELQVSEPSEPRMNCEEEMVVASKIKVNLLVSEPPAAKESLVEEMVATEAELNLIVSEPSDAKECLVEEMVATEAKLNLLVSEPSDAKESLEEEMVPSEANVNVRVSEPSEAKENLEKELALPKAKLDPLAADVIVETFPVRPITKPTDSFGARSGEVRDATNSWERTKAEVELGQRVGSSMNSFYNSGLVGKSDAEKNKGPLLENSSYSTTKEDIMHNSHGGLGVETNDSRSDVAVVSHNDAKVANDRSGAVAEVKVLNGTSTKYSNATKSIVKDDIAEALPSGSSKKEGAPTLDRINLKSWEEPSKIRRCAQPEKNPLVAFVKSFVTTFMKLWSD